MITKIKYILKKRIPLVVLKNINGFLGAIGSYYPSYLFGNGKIQLLKKVAIEITFKCNCRCQMCPLYGIHTHGGRKIINYMHENNELRRGLLRIQLWYCAYRPSYLSGWGGGLAAISIPKMKRTCLVGIGVK